jgi:hypothetical protein
MKNLMFLLGFLLLTINLFGCQYLSPPQDNTRVMSSFLLEEEETPDTFLDIAFIASDIAWIVTTGTGWGSLALDMGCLLIPGATGAGQAYRSTNMIKSEEHLKKLIQSGNSINQVNAFQGRIRWTTSELNRWCAHVLTTHSSKCMSVGHKYGDKGQGIFYGVSTQSDVKKFLMEAVNKMENGMYIQRATAKGKKHVYEAVVDMGRVIGKTKNKDNRYVRIVIAPGGKGSMYPVSKGEFSIMNHLRAISKYPRPTEAQRKAAGFKTIKIRKKNG